MNQAIRTQRTYVDGRERRLYLTPSTGTAAVGREAVPSKMRLAWITRGKKYHDGNDNHALDHNDDHDTYNHHNHNPTTTTTATNAMRKKERNLQKKDFTSLNQINKVRAARQLKFFQFFQRAHPQRAHPCTANAHPPGAFANDILPLSVCRFPSPIDPPNSLLLRLPLDRFFS